MQTNSRIKKYEDLRETLIEENKENVETPKLSRFAKRLSNIDSEYFQPIVEDYESNILKSAQPARIKYADSTQEYDEYFNEQEILARALRLSSRKQESDSDISDDELLNQFLKEIRNYNQRQGVRSMDDTHLEILKQVKVENKAIPQPRIVEEIVEEKPNAARFNIAKQVRDLLITKENTFSTIEEEMKEENISDVSIDDQINTANEKYLKYIDEDRENKARLLEETQQLRLKLSEHEDELDEIGTGIDYTRKLLNVLLALLLVTILIAGGILIYLVTRG